MPYPREDVRAISAPTPPEAPVTTVQRILLAMFVTPPACYRLSHHIENIVRALPLTGIAQAGPSAPRHGLSRLVVCHPHCHQRKSRWCGVQRNGSPQNMCTKARIAGPANSHTDTFPSQKFFVL